VAGTLGACALAPPVQEMSDARQALAAAEAAGADRHAQEEFGEARRFIAEAEEDIAGERYGAARSKALRAQDRAVRALQIARVAAADE
jgi:hypothetical protein